MAVVLIFLKCWSSDAVENAKIRYSWVFSIENTEVKYFGVLFYWKCESKVRLGL